MIRSKRTGNGETRKGQEYNDDGNNHSARGWTVNEIEESACVSCELVDGRLNDN